MAKASKAPEVESVTSLLVHPLLQDPKFLVAVLAVFVAVVAFSISRPSKAKTARRGGPATVLLIGPSDGGKTSLFAQLSHSLYPQTHTSVLSSSTTFSLSHPEEDGSKQVRLVDMPGHPRLQDDVKKQLAEASAVVFVIDAVSIVRNAGSVTELLPPLLTTLASASLRNPSYPPPKFLFLAHKSDLLIRPTPPAVPSPPNIPDATRVTATERLRSILTREMDRLKAARGSTGGKIEGMGKVAGTSNGGFFGKLFGSAPVEDAGEGEEDETLVWGGRGGFRWEDVEGVEIEWAASGLGMVKMGKEAVGQEVEQGDGLDDLKRFLWEA